MNIDFASRVKRLPPYPFAEIERIIMERRRQGVDLISLGIGDPDLPPPQFVLDALRVEVANPQNHKYSLSQGEPDFKQAAADWYKIRFGVDVDPETEVMALIGSKEGIANVTRAFVNPGDRVLVPDPAYPVYTGGATLLSDGVPVEMPLLKENNFMPDVKTMRAEDAKLMFLNYPNNPTGATADRSFLKQIIEFAEERKVIVCYDNAYSEITFEGYRAPSILEVEGAMNVSVEFHSLSKTFNMTGDRIGFAVGNKQLIKGLTTIKSQIDSGPPTYIQRVAIRALNSYLEGEPPEQVKKNIQTYQERRDLLVESLNSIGFQCNKPKATFYLWLDCGVDSKKFASRLLDVGVVATPGIGFGQYGKNYVRFALTQPLDLIEEACRRIAKLLT